MKIKKETPIEPEEELVLKPQMPKKLIQKFDELCSDWRQKMYDLALEGEADEGLYTSLALSRRRHETLLKVDEYNDWFTYCHEVSINWWMNFGKKVCLRKDYNGAVYNLNMQNRAGWGQNNKIGEKQPEEIPQPEGAVKTIDDFKPETKIEEQAH